MVGGEWQVGVCRRTKWQVTSPPLRERNHLTLLCYFNQQHHEKNENHSSASMAEKSTNCRHPVIVSASESASSEKLSLTLIFSSIKVSASRILISTALILCSLQGIYSQMSFDISYLKHNQRRIWLEIIAAWIFICALNGQIYRRFDAHIGHCNHYLSFAILYNHWYLLRRSDPASQPLWLAILSLLWYSKASKFFKSQNFVKCKFLKPQSFCVVRALICKIGQHETAWWNICKLQNFNVWDTLQCNLYSWFST